MHQWELPHEAAGIDAMVLRKDVPIPTPTGAQLLVRMKALSINYRDQLIAATAHLGPTVKNVVPLSDGAGEVVTVGPDCTRFKVGDRVALTFYANNPESGGDETIESLPARGGNCHGTAATYVVAESVDAVHIPTYMTYEEAAALPCAGVTAWHALNAGEAPLAAGKIVLVQGTGGVSSLAAQLAHAMGCRVIALSSSADKIKGLIDLGVVKPNDWVNYREHPKWGEAVLALTPDKRGVDVVVEVVGISSANESLTCATRRGVVSLIGVLNNQPPPDGFQLHQVLMKRLRVVGIQVGTRNDFEEMLKVMEKNEVHPVMDPRPFLFPQLPDAYRYLQSAGHSGKIIVQVEE